MTSSAATPASELTELSNSISERLAALKKSQQQSTDPIAADATPPEPSPVTTEESSGDANAHPNPPDSQDPSQTSGPQPILRFCHPGCVAIGARYTELYTYFYYQYAQQ